MYRLTKTHNNGSKIRLDFTREKDVLGYLYENLDMSDTYTAGEVPYFFADKEDLLIYGGAKFVYNPLDENAHYYNGDYVYRVIKLKKDKCIMIEGYANRKGLDIEVYAPYNSRVKLVENLHTDNCQFINFGLDGVYDEDIADYEIASPEQYNRTLYANCGELTEESTLVVLLKK